jgi:hypothetical protein
VDINDGRISRIDVVRGASCGATWDAAARMVGMLPDEAIIRMGLEVQFFCTADPSGWDPIYGKSPVHLAGKLHSSALGRAIDLSKARTIEKTGSGDTK